MMGKLYRDLGSKEKRSWWRAVLGAAAEVSAWPQWKKDQAITIGKLRAMGGDDEPMTDANDYVKERRDEAGSDE